MGHVNVVCGLDGDDLLFFLHVCLMMRWQAKTCLENCPKPEELEK
jgi:hypothetical protein